MEVREEIGKFYQFETWRLAQIILNENDAFAKEKYDLLKRYGHEVLDPSFISFVPAHVARRWVSALQLSVENRVREFNKNLYQLLCVRFRWCEKRDRTMVENAEIIASIADIFGAHGVAALTVFLIKRKFLDKFCKCKAQIRQ